MIRRELSTAALSIAATPLLLLARLRGSRSAAPSTIRRWRRHRPRPLLSDGPAAV